MAIKIFLLGRPGSGKSTAARYIDSHTKKKGWCSIHINDYRFLRAMFEADTHHQKFLPSECGGFDVTDFSVLDLALQAVEREALQHLPHFNHILLIEFARNDYATAFRQFQRSFLHDAYFLFFDADINMCIQRVYKRSYHPSFSDDHFISEEMIRNYYREEHLAYWMYQLLLDYNISEHHIRMIKNVSAKLTLYRQIKAFIEEVTAQEVKKESARHTQLVPNRICCKGACTVNNTPIKLASLVAQADLT